MTKATQNAKHMKQTVKKSNKGRIVAIALAGVLAVGGVAGAVCAAGLGKVPMQAPPVTQMAESAPATKSATMKQADAKSTAKKTEAKKSEAKPAAKSNAKKAAKKAETKPATKQAAKKAEAKPAAKQAEAKPAAKKAEAKPAAKPAQKQATKQAAQPAAKKAAPAGNANDGTEAKLSREQCVKIACDYVGAGGQAKGPAMNVSAKRVVGGGTTYYAVELDLGDVHYRVCVDAIDGHTYSSDMTHAGTTVCLDEQGNPVEGTEQPADNAQVTKKAEAAKNETPQTKTAKSDAAKPEATKADANKGNGLEEKLSREECIRKACAYVGAGGQAKGPAMNVSAKRVVGSGTIYYAVELDLGDVHYSVQVDAIGGDVISADQVHAGTRTLLDKQGNLIEGTEQEA